VLFVVQMMNRIA